MKDSSRSRRINDWVSQQLQGTATRPPAGGSDRRRRPDRRKRAFWSVLYGSFNPRRRRPARRLNDSRFYPIDWHSAHLLAVSIGILLFSAADAFLTAILLVHGADEINPVMALLVYRSLAAFAAFKMAMTGLSLLVMVILARYRFMRLIRVEIVMYAVLLVYAWLIGYEIWMLRGTDNLPVL
ncbi:MAG TPA: DUF5658 family protein [Steroidobacteraceae bacterium]|jgi:hypothetical protein|nr:DUF5658 family protein [Steroidobacteraceae bacterium]